MERILVVYYSQSGQLKQIVDHFVAPFIGAGISVDYYEIEMETPFPFPWNNEAFFGAFPESFLQIPQPIKPLPAAIMEQQYSLVVLAYQVWYLSPSIPITSFLKSEQAAHLLSGKPVVTLSGTRNMWIKAQEKIGQMLQKYNATILANIALTDRHHNHISVLTIVHWLFTGEKDRYLGIFPLPGVSDRDIASATQYGEIVLKHKQIADHSPALQKEIVAQALPALGREESQSSLWYMGKAHLRKSSPKVPSQVLSCLSIFCYMDTYAYCLAILLAYLSVFL